MIRYIFDGLIWAEMLRRIVRLEQRTNLLSWHVANLTVRADTEIADDAFVAAMIEEYGHSAEVWRQIPAHVRATMLENIKTDPLKDQS